MQPIKYTSPKLLYTYISLWAIGHLQEMFLTSSLLSLALYLPFVLMTLTYVYQVIVSKPRGMMRIISIFFFILLLYGLFSILLDSSGKQYGISFLMTVIGSIGPIFAFYTYAKKGLLTYNRLMASFFLFLLIAILEYYDTEREALNTLSKGVEEITNNSSYTILGLFPFLFLFKKHPILQYLGLALIIFYVISAMKRGAIIVLIILLIWFVYVMLKSASGKRKFIQIVLIGVLAFFSVKFIINFYSESSYFQQRIESTLEGRSSNRDVIYSVLWQHYISNQSLSNILFGEGVYKTISITGGVKAHNDWLELLIDCGFMGVILYCVYWVRFYREWRRCRKLEIIHSILGACLVFTFMKTIFSMSFTSIPFGITMMMGYCFASILYSKKTLN